MAYLLTKTLTEIEEAVLTYGHYSGLISKKKYTHLYMMASGDQEATATIKGYASRYFDLPKVNAFIEQLRRNDAQRDLANFEKGKREGEREGGSDRSDDGRGVDYSVPDAQKALLNEIINTSTDTKDKLDAVKVIISGQRDDRQAAREQKQVKFYLAQRCYECPLYQSVKNGKIK